MEKYTKFNEQKYILNALLLYVKVRDNRMKDKYLYPFG